MTKTCSLGGASDLTDCFGQTAGLSILILNIDSFDSTNKFY